MILDQYQVLWRCINIAKAIERTGLHHATLIDISSFIANDEKCMKVCDEADLIVIHRYCVGPILQIALFWKARKKKIVLDIDEAIGLMPEDMEQYHFWGKGEVPAHFFPSDILANKIVPTPSQQITWAMMQIDAMTVSSERLAGDYEGFGKVWVIEDYIDFNQYLVTKAQHRDELLIGFGGGPISYLSIERIGLVEALEEVCRQRKQVRLFMGNMPTELMQRINVPNNQKVIYSWIPPEDWAFYLANLDIGLAPAVGDYDIRASNNRVLEYLALKIPWIASDHLPYRDLNELGTLVDDTKEAWLRGLLATIDSIDGYKKKAEKAPFLYAISRDINENVGKILKIYDSILKD
jgi:glycosyltransferase involved in cell wall biosynthesis